MIYSDVTVILLVLHLQVLIGAEIVGTGNVTVRSKPTELASWVDKCAYSYEYGVRKVEYRGMSASFACGKKNGAIQMI
jgi:hypothetical protein